MGCEGTVGRVGGQVPTGGDGQTPGGNGGNISGGQIPGGVGNP
jgi:hypothetical protein